MEWRRKREAIVKFPYGYGFRKSDVLILLRERKRLFALVRDFAKVNEIEYLQSKIRYKKGVIDLSEDKVAERWVNICRFWLRPV